MPGLIWKPEHIPLGATVFLVPPGSDEPAIVDGSPIPFRALYGGVENPGKKLYPLPANQPQRGVIATTSVGLGSFMQGVRFSPVQTYTPEKAPVDGRYAVFDGEKRMLDERLKAIGGEYPLEVAKANNGRLYASSAFPFEPHQLSGNPAFGSPLIWQGTPDDELASLIESRLQSISTLKKVGWAENDISAAEFSLAEIVEALAGRHRGTPSDFVGMFSRFGSLYLRPALLPATAQLVRTDKEDTIYAQSAAVRTSA